ncbi:glycosyltransferase family A protein [Corynebacterium sp.]|uniref:glycosyltransferase family 2 protein n=1 Tax=Corynebacterium sp. TaxID=1720 RepID=UPI0026DB72C3|nr:glycosyltransferase family A protein [Corynebacterium sp.]MDO5076779.1 glycosyltransferase family A protein [Corynebacterium sp.]
MISVILPFYNEAEHLPRVLACLDRLENVEVLLINDGSTDESPNIAEDWGGGRVIHQENLGIAAARERGIREATGEWIWFVDSDDTFDPYILQRMVAASDDVDLVICRAHHYDQQGRIRVMEGVADEAVIEDVKAAIFDGTIRGYLWNKLFRAEVLKRAIDRPDRQEHLSSLEDFMLLLDALPEIRRARLIPFIGYHYRDREGSVMETDPQRVQNTSICAETVAALGAPRSFRVWFHAVPCIATTAYARVPGARKVQLPLLRYLTPPALLQTWSSGHRREAVHGAVMAVTVPFGVYSPLYRARHALEKLLVRSKC